MSLPANIKTCPVCGGPNPQHDAAAEPQLEMTVSTTFPEQLPELRVSKAAFKPQRLEHQKPPAELTVNGPARRLDCMDHPEIGGKFTVFVLCYGNYPDLARRCIDSILHTFPRNRIHLRVACNEPAAETLHYLENAGPDLLLVNEHNAKKYPVMRELFHESLAIETRYCLWFDDDTQIVNPRMVDELCQLLITNQGAPLGMVGRKMSHDLHYFQDKAVQARQWYEQASWWRGKPLRIGNKQRWAPNGSVIDFIAGWFWCIKTEAIYAADIPDPRIYHNGGDVSIGEAMHQTGYNLLNFNERKQFVSTPAKERGGRRGFSESFEHVFLQSHGSR